MAIVALCTKLDAKKPRGHPSSLEQAKPRSHAGCLTECDVRTRYGRAIRAPICCHLPKSFK